MKKKKKKKKTSNKVVSQRTAFIEDMILKEIQTRSEKLLKNNSSLDDMVCDVIDAALRDMKEEINKNVIVHLKRALKKEIPVLVYEFMETVYIKVGD